MYFYIIISTQIKLTLVLLAGVCLVQQLANGARDQESFKCLAEKISNFSEAAFKESTLIYCLLILFYFMLIIFIGSKSNMLLRR